jgi:hypothetical protein
MSYTSGYMSGLDRLDQRHAQEKTP